MLPTNNPVRISKDPYARGLEVVDAQNRNWVVENYLQGQKSPVELWRPAMQVFQYKFFLKHTMSDRQKHKRLRLPSPPPSPQAKPLEPLYSYIAFKLSTLHCHYLHSSHVTRGNQRSCSFGSPQPITSFPNFQRKRTAGTHLTGNDRKAATRYLKKNPAKC
jgi:hypothetical protein